MGMNWRGGPGHARNNRDYAEKPVVLMRDGIIIYKNCRQLRIWILFLLFVISSELVISII